uniref:Esterase, PHB depolymerase family n=1 Tax=Rhodopseudomonas palustris (strain BisA53) TaxID=316055 RepID=Q07V39_RHOP5
MSLASNLEFLRNLRKLNGVSGLDGHAGPPPGASRLVETPAFGSNPGELRMWSYVPPELPPKAGLVVVLHGCTQTAAGYELGAGWSTLARRYGFALLMPEQTKANNARLCFNWFEPGDIQRGEGEPASIRAMVEQMVRTHGLDRKKIFVTGLSAGGAMSAVMLATYPDVFAGGAVIAGLPYGVANNVRQALHAMMRPPSHTPRHLGDRVRHASPHQGPWPKLSVWHGSADRTVHPANADQLVRQWLDLHGLPAAPMSQSVVDGHPRQVWWNEDGEPVVESYTIADMAHGTPLGIGENDERFGAQGAFLLEVGISSSYHIAKFFGLTGRVHLSKQAEKTMAHAPGAEEIPQATRAGSSRRDPPRDKPGGRLIDVSAVITKALTAAGLMK